MVKIRTPRLNRLKYKQHAGDSAFRWKRGDLDDRSGRMKSTCGDRASARVEINHRRIGTCGARIGVELARGKRTSVASEKSPSRTA